MIDTTPKIYLLAEPTIVLDQMYAYLKEVGGEEWYERVVAPEQIRYGSAGATSLVEFCGRLCYRSWVPGLNKNVKKIREDTADYILNILTTRHGSVVEHAHFTFVLHDVSRVLTAELNRHRHPNISEQSLRYVRLDQDLRFRLPHGVLKPRTIEVGRDLVKHIEDQIGRMYALEGIDDMDSFHAKKTATSAIRRFAPMGISTEEAWTANLRDLRWVIQTRSSRQAEEEIRIVVDQIAQIMSERMPFFFNDFNKNEYGEWVTEHDKV